MPTDFMGNIDCSSCDTGKPKASTAKLETLWQLLGAANSPPCLRTRPSGGMQGLACFQTAVFSYFLGHRSSRACSCHSSRVSISCGYMDDSLKARANPAVRTFRRWRGMHGGALTAFKLRKPSPSFSVFAQGLQAECKACLLPDCRLQLLPLPLAETAGVRALLLATAAGLQSHLAT